MHRGGDNFATADERDRGSALEFGTLVRCHFAIWDGVGMHIETYLSELRFALSATPNWNSRFKLLAATTRFHLNNFKRSASADQTPVELDLNIGRATRTLAIRPYSGDIFILYEVLAWESYKVPERLIEPGSVKTIIDCGANIGLTALYLADRYPNARIVSVEPDPVNFALLVRNTKAEPRIIPVQAALVGKRQGPVILSQDRPACGNSISSASGGSSSGSSGGSSGGIEVASVTMADLCAAHGIASIELLKVDIEGAEEGVFADPQFLRMVRYVMIELHGDYTLEKFRRDIAPMGFTAEPPGAADGPRAVTAFPAKSSKGRL